MPSYSAAAGARMRQRKRKAIAAYKSMIGCQHCGFSNPVALQAHHVDPLTKGYESSRKLWDLAWHRIWVELDKCIILCANCHFIEEDRLRSD